MIRARRRSASATAPPELAARRSRSASWAGVAMPLVPRSPTTCGGSAIGSSDSARRTIAQASRRRRAGWSERKRPASWWSSRSSRPCVTVADAVVMSSTTSRRPIYSRLIRGVGLLTSQVGAVLKRARYGPLVTVTDRTSAGELLRDWRLRRRLSQLDLALESGVSARHLSFLETGRSRPSRAMVLRLAEKLEVPLRDRNRLLLAAGFAPAFDERPLEAPEMEPV